MPTFRDLLPAPPDDLADAAKALGGRQIQGETVAEAIARGVEVQVVPIQQRETVETAIRWGNDGFLAGRGAPGPKAKLRRGWRNNSRGVNDD